MQRVNPLSQDCLSTLHQGKGVNTAKLLYFGIDKIRVDNARKWNRQLLVSALEY